MNDNNKKQRRVSFASEAPEQNVYEKEVTINSFTTDDLTADFTCEQTKIGKSFYENPKNDNKINESMNLDSKINDNKINDNKINDNINIDNSKIMIEEDDKENDSIMSNNTAVFDELVNTQYIRTIVPQHKPVQININELLMEQGIRFLDDIVVSSTRRETLSKSKKEVDPKNVVYYKNFLTHRIKFFEDFSEDLKNELNKLSEELKQVETNFQIKNTLLEKEDKSKLRSLKSDCRNRANVSWYELRAKKELEFNDQIIKIKNDLIKEYNHKENLLESLKKQNESVNEDIKNINEKLDNIISHDLINITNQSLEKLYQDISNHEQVLEDYLVEYEKLKIDVNNKKINENVKEVKYLEMKNEISDLEKQFRSVSVNENDLNDIKNEYEKYTAILGIEILELKKDFLFFKFLEYEITLNKDLNQGNLNGKMTYQGNINDKEYCYNNDFTYKNEYTIVKDIKLVNIKSIIHEFGVLTLKNRNMPFLEIIRFLINIHEIYKEVCCIKETNSVDIFLENNELHLLINVNDLRNFRNYKFKVTIFSNLEMLLEKGGSEFRYNLYERKGFILAHI